MDAARQADHPPFLQITETGFLEDLHGTDDLSEVSRPSQSAQFGRSRAIRATRQARTRRAKAPSRSPDTGPHRGYQLSVSSAGMHMPDSVARTGIVENQDWTFRPDQEPTVPA